MTDTDVEVIEVLMIDEPEAAELWREAEQLWAEAELLEQEADRIPEFALTLLK